jgi:hypothetical protein
MKMKEEFLKEYYVWVALKQRCYNKKNKAYKYYGGKGVTVCDDWKNSFELFIFDMGPRPEGKFSIDRIDSSKGYSKENCRWADLQTQLYNRSCSRSFSVDGIAYNKNEIHAKFGVCRQTLDTRLRRGWSLDDAVKIPIGQRTGTNKGK